MSSAGGDGHLPIVVVGADAVEAGGDALAGGIGDPEKNRIALGRKAEGEVGGGTPALKTHGCDAVEKIASALFWKLQPGSALTITIPCPRPLLKSGELQGKGQGIAEPIIDMDLWIDGDMHLIRSGLTDEEKLFLCMGGALETNEQE